MKERVDRIADPWGPRTPYGAGEDEDSARGVSSGTVWPARVDEYVEAGVEVEDWVHSACVLCSTGCGVDMAVAGGKLVGVRGRETDANNRGRLGPKGLFGSCPPQRSEDRLLRPLIRRDGELVETDWETAMGAIVDRSRAQIEQHTGSSIGFYTSGQLFIEEYYTLGLLGKAGIGSPHMDGNTRLCTATAAAALKESFGADGQPGTMADLDSADTMFHWGHNMAEQNSVLWMRVLDRLAGSDPPRLVVVDPRRTPAARVADLHLALKPGTNMALLNAIQHELIEQGWIDRQFIEGHVWGFGQLATMVKDWTPERAAEVCHVPADDIRQAARIFGEGRRVLSTVLQGFFQSWQATASCCQVNNLHLLRGMIGKPGASVLQMNGQPTSQNTRETGADGDVPGFRNWSNLEHIRELAELWNIDVDIFPHWSPPTHAMQIWRYAEQGSIGLLWISATNPAVSMPELARIRTILSKPELFVVVQDLFLTETARLADVVLPASMWGEKTGTFTNADRSVHLSEKAVDPPGEARSDFDIWVDYARRMDFRDKDGAPLVRWSTPEEAYRAWALCSKGRPCDYSGLTYEMLRREGTVQWPVNEEHPEGTARLYTDAVFPTEAEYCESYPHDLQTGAAWTESEFRALELHGRAMLRACQYTPFPEQPDAEYPFVLTTGRTIFHFHTRTKTGRAEQLVHAAPDVWLELSPADAERLSAGEGDVVRVETRRGVVEARVRVTDIAEGVCFLPFHYGYWDVDQPGGEPDPARSAANELTITEWDAVSKQPLFKVSAARVTRLRAADGEPSAAPPVSAVPAHRGPIVLPGAEGGAAALASSDWKEE